jgi:hypothetical protein
MKNLIITSALIFVFAFGAFSQSSQIDISEKGNLIKKKVFTKCDIELTDNQLITLFKNDPNMKDYYKPMALTNAGGALLYSVGMALVLWPVAESLYADSNPNWNLAYIGAGCVILAIPLKRAYTKRATQAVEYYNSGYKRTSSIDLNVGGNGLGLVMKF